MADIELVIKIPEGLKKDFESEQWTALSCMEMKNALEKATPLPKGHGTLKDANVMINKLCTHEASEFFGSTTCAEILDFINAEKPIIEADTKSGE